MSDNDKPVDEKSGQPNVVDLGGTDWTMAVQIQTIQFLQSIHAAGYDPVTAMKMVTDGLAKTMAWHFAQVGIALGEDALAEEKKYMEEKYPGYLQQMNEVLVRAKELIDAKMAEIKAEAERIADVRSKGANVVAGPWKKPTHEGSGQVN